MLETIGALAIIIVIIYASIKHYEHTQNKALETQSIKENYSKIINLKTKAILKEDQIRRRFNNDNYSAFYPNELLDDEIRKIWQPTNDAINKILNDPHERAIALKEIIDKSTINQKDDFEDKHEDVMGKQLRLISRKKLYDEMVFSIFGAKMSITCNEFIEGVMSFRKVNVDDAHKILDECIDLCLIEKLLLEDTLLVGHILLFESYKSSDRDLTIYEWRRKNGIVGKNND